MFCCTLLFVHSSIEIILMGKRKLVASLNLSSWCLVMVEWLFHAVAWGCLLFVIVVFPDYTHLLYSTFSFFFILYRSRVCRLNHISFSLFKPVPVLLDINHLAISSF